MIPSTVRSRSSRPDSRHAGRPGRPDRLQRGLAAILASCLAATALLAAGCSGDDDEKWKGETITIGSVFSITGDGVAFGPQPLKAAR